MNLKTLALGLAVASVATFSMAKPVAYTIDPTHSATVFLGATLVSLHHLQTSVIYRVRLMLIMKNLRILRSM